MFRSCWVCFHTHVLSHTDDKRLKNTLNKLNVRDIPAIEEVSFYLPSTYDTDYYSKNYLF